MSSEAPTAFCASALTLLLLPASRDRGAGLTNLELDLVSQAKRRTVTFVIRTKLMLALTPDSNPHYISTNNAVLSYQVRGARLNYANPSNQFQLSCNQVETNYSDLQLA